MVMFITDGHPTVGETEEAAISKNAKAANKGSRVFTFGVGEDLNARLLDRIAEDGRGTSDFARDGKDFEVRLGPVRQGGEPGAGRPLARSRGLRCVRRVPQEAARPVQGPAAGGDGPLPHPEATWRWC